MTAVVILHYNRIDLTTGCVRSVWEQTEKPLHVLVVDNASTAHDEKTLANALPPGTETLRMESSGGFSGGMNAGIRVVLRDPKVDSVLLLNNDTRCPPGLVAALRATLESDSSIGMVGCEQKGADGGESQPAAYRLSGFFAIPRPVEPGEPFDYLQGSCLLVRRAALENVGLWDESFFFFGEDTDLSLRFRKAGWKLALAPEATILHLGSATIGGASGLQSAWYRSGMRRLLDKWRTSPWLRAFPPFAFRLIVDLLKGRFAAVCGGIRGFRHPALAADTRLSRPPEKCVTIAVNTLFFIPGEVGGSETYLRQTLRAMAAIATRHRFLVLTTRENHDTLLADLSPFGNVFLVPTGVVARSRLSRLFGEWRTVPRLLRRYRAAVLWNPGNFALSQKVCPSVTTLHDMQYRHFPEDYSPVELLAMRLFTALTVRASSRVLAISEFTKGEILRFFPALRGRIDVVPHGVADTPADRAPAGEPLEPPTVLCVANSYPHKRLQDAVGIFAALATEFPSLRLRIVGQPRRGEKALRRAIQDLPTDMQSRVCRDDRIPSAALARAYRSCAVFLSTSRYEGFGLPVLEALHAGAAVVACRAGAVSEVGGDAVSYFEPGNLDQAAELIRGILKTPPTTATRARFRVHASSFTWTRTAEETLRLLLPRIPRVTVITPCFNSTATLPFLLDSIDKQAEDVADGLFEMEHIVMDGGSTDGTLDLLASRSRPWRIVISEPDHGPADAINKGFARATGDYVAWLNADDSYAPTALIRAVNALERRPRASFAFGRCPIVDANGAEIRRPITRFKELFFPFHFRWVLQTLNFVSQPATLFRKSALDAAGPLRTDLKAAWDYDLLLRLRRLGPCVRIPGRVPIAYFRWTPASISGANFRRQFDEELALAIADAGRFSLPAILHRAVRWGIVTIYARMTKRSAAPTPGSSKPTDSGIGN